ncbi:MAG: phosphatidate cytidylyltransferase [Clostridiales bacterium]|nr:phosphatidate cytidylyltransferase [Clostridiales bacterium]
MKIRLLSGTVYIAILVAFFCLKIVVPTVNGVPYGDFCFDVLIYAFALLGTFEMLRAVKEKTSKIERGIVYAFTAVIIPALAICQWKWGNGWTVIGIGVFALAVALFSLLVIAHEKVTLESLGLSLFSAVYPTLLLCLLVLTNHATGDGRLARFALDSRVMILFIFVISPCADSIAYLFGRYMKGKFPKKMAPKLSPNKTVIGGIGGLVGGILGAVALYFIYNACVGTYEKMAIVLPVYIGIGLLAAVATAFGDLVESSIKRKVGLKDMGNIMPGHGGALDRLDGTFFATVAVYIAFTAIHWLAGMVL